MARLEADLNKAEEDYKVSDACCRTIAEHNNALKGKNCELSSILDVTQKARPVGCVVAVVRQRLGDVLPRPFRILLPHPPRVGVVLDEVRDPALNLDLGLSSSQPSTG